MIVYFHVFVVKYVEIFLGEGFVWFRISLTQNSSACYSDMVLKTS